MNVRFLYNGIKVDNGSLIPVYYLFDIDNNIIIKAKSFIKRLPQEINGLKRQNNSDLQSDYFDTDFIQVKQNSKYYKEVMENFLTAEKKKLRRVNTDIMLRQINNNIEKIENILKDK